MLSPNSYTLIHAVDLHRYYSVPEHHPVNCGLCSDALEAMPLQDHVLHDQKTHWYFCPKCRFAGTGLEYLAKIENVSPVRILKRLAGENVLRGVSQNTLQAYREYCEQTKSFESAYRSCQPFERTASGRLRTMENLDTYPQANTYRMGDRKTFERLFHPNISDHTASGSRLFRGRNWSRITAIPLYDMPMRQSGILFVNGHEKSSSALVLKRLGPRQGGIHSFEPGYLCPSEIVSGNRPPESIVISSDWPLVLELQTKMWHQSQELAPIVAWFPSDPRTGKPLGYRWTFFRDAVKIFWFRPGDLVSLREACLQEAMVSRAYYQGDSRPNLEPEPKFLSSGFLRSITVSPIPWHQALRWHLEQEPEKIDSHLSTLQLPQRILEEFLRHISGALRKRIASRFFEVASSRYVDGRVITGTEEGWFQEAAHPDAPLSQLSSARCLVDRVVCIAEQEPLYQGRILIRDEILPFCESESVIEKNAVRFVRNVCVRQRSDYLPIINVGPEKMMRLIRAHANMKTVHIKSGFGWDDESSSLILPNMTFSDAAVLEPETPLATGPFHALNVGHKESLTKFDYHALVSFQEETPYLMAMLTALFPALFAPAFRMETPQTVVLDSNTELVEQLFRILHLPVVERAVTKTVSEYAKTNRCPFLVKLHAKRSKNVESWMDAVGLYGCSFVAAPLESVLARMSCGYANLLSPPGIRCYHWLQGKLPDVYLKCFVALLRHFSRYVLEPKITSDNWNSDLIQEAYRYIKSELGLPVHKATLYDGYYEPSAYFCDYLNLLQHREELVLTQTESGLLVPVAPLGDCFRRHLGVFEFDRSKAMLSRSMLLKEYDPEKHAFLLDPEPLEAGAKRLELLYGHVLR